MVGAGSRGIDAKGTPRPSFVTAKQFLYYCPAIMRAIAATDFDGLAFGLDFRENLLILTHQIFFALCQRFQFFGTDFES
jgi:hypothetical protein